MSIKSDIIMNTQEEEEAITAAALSDPDAKPLTQGQLDQFRPARPRGRPLLSVTKIPTNLRLDPDVLGAFKATGPGWQSRINEALRDWAATRGMLER